MDKKGAVVGGSRTPLSPRRTIHPTARLVPGQSTPPPERRVSYKRQYDIFVKYDASQSRRRRIRRPRPKYTTGIMVIGRITCE